MERAAAKRLRKLAATTGRHQSPPTEKDQSTFAPQTTSRKRTPSSKKTVKSYSEMNLTEFCRRRKSGKIPLMKASAELSFVQTVDHDGDREKDVSKNWNKIRIQRNAILQK